MPVVRLVQKLHHQVPISYSQNQHVEPGFGVYNTADKESDIFSDQVGQGGEQNHVSVRQYVKVARGLIVGDAIVLYLKRLSDKSFRRYHIAGHSVMRHGYRSGLVGPRLGQSGICAQRRSTGTRVKQGRQDGDGEEDDHAGGIEFQLSDTTTASASLHCCRLLANGSAAEQTTTRFATDCALAKIPSASEIPKQQPDPE